MIWLGSVLLLNPRECPRVVTKSGNVPEEDPKKHKIKRRVHTYRVLLFLLTGSLYITRKQKDEQGTTTSWRAINWIDTHVHYHRRYPFNYNIVCSLPPVLTCCHFMPADCSSSSCWLECCLQDTIIGQVQQRTTVFRNRYMLRYVVEKQRRKTEKHIMSTMIWNAEWRPTDTAAV